MMNVFKKSLYALCFSLILFSDINAQEETKPAGFCGTAPQKTQWLKQYQRDISKFEHLRGKSMIYLPLTVSVLTNNDGSSNYSTARVLEQLCQLNEDYKAINIYFYLASPVRTIRNSNMNNHKTYDQVFDSLFSKYNVEKTINVYFTNNAAENCGYDIPGTGMVLAKGCMGATSHTWAHEMGHELSLPHTFLGWESTDYNAAKPTPADIDGFPVEKLDKSNCIDAGDGFCDTPPDYLSSRWTCNAQGKSSNTLKDPNGATFQVDGTFFMAYPNDVCMNRFSVQQMDAMRANALSEKIDMLSTALDTKPIKDTITLISPSEEAVINSDSVTFTWSKVPNATRYYFEVARNNKMTQNPIGYDLEDNQITIKLPRKTYYWRVRPYNLTSTCPQNTEVKAKGFSTDVSSSNVLDINALENFVVFPNPIQSDGILKLKINAKHAGKITLSLNDITGRQIMSQRQLLNDGENEIDFPIGTLSTGLYLLRLDAPVGSVQRKVSVF